MRTLPFVLLFFCNLLFSQGTANLIDIHKLQCEYLVNPLGIDTPTPRLRWQLQDGQQGAKQTAYQILVGTDSTAVAKGVGELWDSKKVKSDAMLVIYSGKPLKPFTKYYWTVQVWDKAGKKSSLASVASFETGMMEMQNWQGSWISDSEDVNLKPVPYFRKTVTPKASVKTARIYITAAGLYELSINGTRIGNHQLDPTYTRFDRRNLYVTYDVTPFLQAGEAAIGVLLGNGWYNHQSTAVWNFHEAPWRARPRFLLNLRLTYEDGTTETIATGDDWKTDLSPVIFTSIYTAEHYDARAEQPGWNTVSFDDSQWKKAIVVDAPSDLIVAQVLHPIRHTKEIIPAAFQKISNQHYFYDLGRTISGVSRLSVQGEKGTVIRLKHAEIAGDSGRVDQSNIDVHYRPTDDSDPFQTDIFILNGEGLETFTPRFNYKGFQYIEVTSDKPISLTKESLTGLFMHSDVPAVGTVQSSNPTLDKIWAATNASYLSNLFGYPTDCPQREKNGWTGDAHIASETGLYNFDGITIYEKWLADHRDEQQPNGVLPSIIPTGGWGYEWGNGPDWTSTIAIIPWNIYLFYGDRKLLEDSYDNMKLYVDYISSIDSNYLTDWGLGDWVPVKSVTPKEFTSSIYYYVDASILAKAAQLLGKMKEHNSYALLAENIKRAINDKYLNAETGIYGSGLQTELSAALFWGIVPDNLKEKVAENLKNRVLADNKHIDVGLLGTKTILNALSENGYPDLAYEVATQETFPSWGWWIKNGATTLYENWPIDAKSDISRNHIMFGEIGAWFYKALGGIKPDPQQPGFKHILLRPHFAKGLDSFEATHDGPYGKIRSSWKKTGDEEVTYHVTIPPNSTATLQLDAKDVTQNGKGRLTGNGESFIIKLEAGRYEFLIHK